jgi:hypothetical protein
MLSGRLKVSDGPKITGSKSAVIPRLICSMNFSPLSWNYVHGVALEPLKV